MLVSLAPDLKALPPSLQTLNCGYPCCEEMLRQNVSSKMTYIRQLLIRMHQGCLRCRSFEEGSELKTFDPKPTHTELGGVKFTLLVLWFPGVYRILNIPWFKAEVFWIVICQHVCVCVRIHIYIYRCVSNYASISISVSVYTHIYIYSMYICMHTTLAGTVVVGSF